MDIATLGIAIDSTPVESGKKALDEFSQAADKAEKSARDVGKGAKDSTRGIKEFEDAMTQASLKGALGASAIEKGVQMAIDAVKQLYALMSQAGDYADLADMTGASAVNIAKLQTAADVAGVSMQSMAGYMNMMTRTLKATDEEGDKAARALQRINISFEDFQRLDPAERMAALGQAMNNYADGAEKTEIAQALFGRGAGEVLKVLKELGDAEAFTTRLTMESITAVDGLNDANARFTSQSRQYIQAILVGTVPATEAFKQVIKETTASMFGMGDAADSLAANQGMSEFSKQTGHFLAVTLSACQLVYRAIESLIELIQTLVRFIVNLVTVDFDGVMDSIVEFKKEIESIWSEDTAMTSYKKKLDAMGKSARDAAAAAAGGEGARADPEKARIEKAESDKAIADAKKQREDFDKIVGANAAKASGYNADFIEQMKIINAESKVRNFTEVQYKAAVDALIAQQPFYEDGVKNQTKALDDAKKKREEFAKLENAIAAKQTGYNENYKEQVALIVALAKTEAQRKRLLDDLMKQQPVYQNQLKMQADAMKEVIDAEQKMIDKAAADDAATLKSSADAAKAAETELANFGKLKSEIAETTLLRLQDTLEMVKADPISRKFYEQQIADQRRVVNALKGTEMLEAHKKAADEAKKEYDKAWEQVGQSFADQLMEGGRSASDYLKNLFRTMILRPTIMAAFAGGGIGGGSGGGGGGGMGMVSNATSLYGAYGAFSSGMGLSGMAGGAGIMGTVGNAAAGYAGATGGLSTAMGVGAYGPVMSSSGAAGAAVEGYLASTGVLATEGATAAGVAGASTAGAGAGASAALGAVPVAGWVALAAIAAYAAYKKWGKHKGGPKVEGSEGIGPGGIGVYGDAMDANAQRAVLDLSSQYRRMAQMLGSTKTEMGFGVGYSMDPHGTAPSMVQIRSEISESVNLHAGRTAEELAKALSEGAATVMVEALRNSGMDSQMLAYFDKITVGMEDQAKLAAFEQVAAVGAYWKSMQTLGSTMKNFANISLEAAVRLAELAGGVENLAAGISTYQQHFLKPAEQESAKYQAIAATLNEAGAGWYGFTEQLLRTYTKERFRQIVEGLNLEDEGDRQRYISMMKVAGAFAELKESTDYAGAAQQRYTDALDALRGAYDRQKEAVTSIRDAMRSATESFLDFNKSIMVDSTLSTLSPQDRMRELEEQYGAARNKAAGSSYKAEDVARMQEAARALLQGGREYYASGEGYDDLFRKIHEEMTDAANRTLTMEAVAEMQLSVLETQVGHLVNIDATLISVNDALVEFLAARTAVYTLGYPHAEGLSRVPFDNYPALLHQNEMVLPQNESAFIRSLPDFSGELRALRQEVAALRKENRQDAGNTIGATYTATANAAQVQSEATIRAARQRVYQSRSRPVLA